MQVWNVVIFKTGCGTLLEHLKLWSFLLNRNSSKWSKDFQWKYIVFFHALFLRFPPEACTCFTCATPETFIQQTVADFSPVFPSRWSTELSSLSLVPTRKLRSTWSISEGSKYVVQSSLVSVTKSKGEFYLLAKIRLSKQNVAFSDIWFLLLLLRKLVIAVFLSVGFKTFATCSDLFFFCWYRIFILLKGVMHI